MTYVTSFSSSAFQDRCQTSGFKVLMIWVVSSRSYFGAQKIFSANVVFWGQRLSFNSVQINLVALYSPHWGHFHLSRLKKIAETWNNKNKKKRTDFADL